MAALGLRVKQLLDIGYLFQVESSDQAENDAAGLDSVDFEHSLFAKLPIAVTAVIGPSVGAENK